MRMLAAAAFLALATPAFAADVTGTWQTPTDQGVVEIKACGNSVCGFLVSSNDLAKNPTKTDAKNGDAALRGRTLKGLQILQGFKWSGGSWSDGKIYNPDDGKTYSSTLTLKGDNTLDVRGCVFVPLCQTQTWTRIK